MDKSNTNIRGFIKIFHPKTETQDEIVLVDKENAIHFENFSEALAESMANSGLGHIHSMEFGNGGTSVDPTGIIAYLPPNQTGSSADLYNSTFSKVVDATSAENTDITRNNMTVIHTAGKTYTDILVKCLLDYGEPVGQQAFDNSTDLSGEYVFDELGLKAWFGSNDDLKLVTHVVFHPFQKSLNRQIQINYTIRISTLTHVQAP